MLTYENAIALGVSEAFTNEELASFGGVESVTAREATDVFARMDADEVYQSRCENAAGLYEWAYAYACNNA